MNKRKKVLKDRGSFGLGAEGEGPGVMRIIIKHHKVVLETRETNNR